MNGLHFCRLILLTSALGLGIIMAHSLVYAEDNSSVLGQRREPRKTEAYLSPYLLGTIPIDKDVSEGGNGFATNTYRGTNIKSSFGGGVKAGAYPGFTSGVLGVEGELFAHGGRLKTPDGAFPSADAKLFVFNSMVNVLARYPGDILQPYISRVLVT